MIDKNLMNKFKEPLINLFDEEEIKCLYKDYLDIEKQWEEFFKRMNFINLVIIAEAPLSGERYIYNPKKNHDSGTQFLRKKQLQKCLEIYKRSECSLEGKGKMELMIELGILVIEAYPFALNPDQHINMNFQKGLRPKAKKELFTKTSSWHFFNKIKKINPKVGPQTVYAFRYIRNTYLNKFIDIKKDIHCLGKRKEGGNIDKEKLFKIFKKL